MVSANDLRNNARVVISGIQLGNSTSSIKSQDMETNVIQHPGIRMLHFSSVAYEMLSVGFGDFLLICFVGILVLIIIICYLPQARECFEVSMDSASAALVGKPPPDFVLVLLDRSDQKISDLANLSKPMVIRFYASREDEEYASDAHGDRLQDVGVKALDEMAQDIKYYQKVLFVLVAIDHPGTTDLQKYNDQMQISDKCIHGQLKRGWDNILKEYSVEKLPHTTVVGANGIVVKNFNSLGTYFVDLRQCVDDLLQGKNEVQEKKTSQASEKAPAKRTAQRPGRRLS